MRTTLRSARGYRAARVAAIALASASLLLISACQDDDTGVPSTTSVVAAPQGNAPGGASGGEGTGRSVIRTVGKTGWYEGFDITVDKATVVPDEYGGGKILIDITYKNTTGASLMPSNNSHLEVGKEVDGGAGFDSPTVPGKSSATGKVTTSVQSLKDADHLLDTMTVVYGETSDNQTRIPLAAAARVESVQPRSLPINGTLTQDQTTVRITAGSLNPSYTKNERGKDELKLHVAFVGGSGVPDGGTNIYYQYFSVRTPDGQTLVADFRGTINELLHKNETIDKADNFVVFVVPSPTKGTYVVSYDSTNGAGNAPTFSFTVQ
ncbi:hypothetical protein [Nocardia arizonensis]|uniref:hypothetical protein n=1 Tax=Nocardia arizonensis TaxID=1141647 RepID=UPI0006D2A672|nr:hypothetical protein [Nocardia arizonensis]